MKLEVGMYVRTKNGNIFKIISGNNDNWVLDVSYVWLELYEDDWLELYKYNDNGSWFNNKNIKKARHNIIDLIEVGDYVNGSEVVLKDFNNLNEECLECGIGDYIVCSYEVKDIKSIVTKEQFESMEYKIC